MDIAPFEGALVGPRVDIYCEGVELATILFNCAKLRRGSLERINYVAGYGIGLERLLSVLSQGDFLSVVPRYWASVAGSKGKARLRARRP